MLKPRVLVSGASVAGPALAYWLVRAGCKVTVVERAPTLRIAGQGVDVRDTARDVIKRMGIFDRIRDKSSHEEGLKIVDSKTVALRAFLPTTNPARAIALAATLRFSEESWQGFSSMSQRTTSPISSATWSRACKKQVMKLT